MEVTTTQAMVYESETTANHEQHIARNDLERLFVTTPLPLQDILFNLGLFTRSSLLVKYIVMHELYQRFINLPGLIVEFGTWWGQNLILLENLRAIHEPFNKQRQIIGFDTFTGYPASLSSKDKSSCAWQKESYSTGKSYKNILEDLLKTHEKNNVLGHLNGLHKLIEGNISITAPTYFQENAHCLVAFAYFDIGLYEPTKAAMMSIKQHLIPGSILLLDELTWADAPGEALAFKEVFNDVKYTIEKCRYYPSKAIVTIYENRR